MGIVRGHDTQEISSDGGNLAIVIYSVIVPVHLTSRPYRGIQKPSIGSSIPWSHRLTHKLGPPCSCAGIDASTHQVLDPVLVNVPMLPMSGDGIA